MNKRIFTLLLAALLLLFLALAGRGRAAESGERELF